MSRDFTSRRAMGAIGSPVALITASHDGRNGIMTANMIAGLSFSPPLVGISLSHHSLTRTLIDSSGEFAVNVISPDQLNLAKNIGSTTGRRIDKFKEFSIGTFQGRSVSCPLVKEAHAVLECKVDRSIELDKHSLYVGLVVAYHDIKEASPLYLYHGNYYSIGDRLGSFWGIK
ncbi:MAG: flavin reductase family protein [Actinobacteria bacterium]|nr:flavin reductase family protein [Actinomycetota bacterium]